MKKTYCIIALFVFIPLINACGGGGGGDKSDDPVIPTVTHALLNGSWRGVCAEGAVDESAVDVLYEFANGQMVFTFTTYSDQDCSTVSMIQPFNGSYTLGADVVLDGSVSGLTGATEINLAAALGDIRKFDIVAIDGSALYIGDTSGANDGSSADGRPIQLSNGHVIKEGSLPSVTHALLNGTWVSSGCFSVGIEAFIKLSNVFLDGLHTVKQTEYTNDSCTGNAQILPDIEGTYTLGVGVTVDGTVAGLITATTIDLMGDVEFFDIVAIDGSTLYTGDTVGANNGSSAGLRPTQLQGFFPFIKQ